MEIYSFKIGDKITRVEPCTYATGDRYNESLNLTAQGEPQYSFDLVGQELTFLGIKNGGINIVTPSGSKYYLTLSDKSKAQWAEGWSYYEPVEVPEKEEPAGLYQPPFWKTIKFWSGLVSLVAGLWIILQLFTNDLQSAFVLISILVAVSLISTGFERVQQEWQK